MFTSTLYSKPEPFLEFKLISGYDSCISENSRLLVRKSDIHLIKGVDGRFEIEISLGDSGETKTYYVNHTIYDLVDILNEE